LNKVHSNY